LVWFDRRGARLGEIGDEEYFDDLQLSPDQKNLAFTSSGDVWILDVARGARRRVTSETGSEFPVIWGMKGDRIYYGRQMENGRQMIVEQLLTVEVSTRTIGPPDAMSFPLDSTADGTLIFQTAPVGGRPDLWVMGPADADAQPLMRTPVLESRAKVSPDGRWIAYMSTRSGAPQVYVTSFPVPREEIPISTSGGRSPRWRNDGRELFYVTNDNQLVGVEVDGRSSEFRAGKEVALFQMSPGGARSQYDVTADGQRFIVNTTSQVQSQEPITVVLNWSRPSSD
jgi:Tol biopolymer transport system component